MGFDYAGDTSDEAHRERKAMRVILMRLLTFSFSTTLVGMTAKRMSVMMFMMEFQRPIKVYVRLGKQ